MTAVPQQRSAVFWLPRLIEALDVAPDTTVAGRAPRRLLRWHRDRFDLRPIPVGLGSLLV